MAGWRDIKAKARGAVHGTFAVPATYLTHADGVVQQVTVRDHTKIAERSADFAEASYLEMTPKVIFSQAEVPEVLRDAFVFFSADEMYRTGAAEPARGGYISVECILLQEAERQRLLDERGEDILP